MWRDRFTFFFTIKFRVHSSHIRMGSCCYLYTVIFRSSFIFVQETVHYFIYLYIFDSFYRLVQIDFDIIMYLFLHWFQWTSFFKQQNKLIHVLNKSAKHKFTNSHKARTCEYIYIIHLCTDSRISFRIILFEKMLGSFAQVVYSQQILQLYLLLPLFYISHIQTFEHSVK